MTARDFDADCMRVCAALLRSSDFQSLGFSARRPLGSRSFVAADVAAVLDLNENADLDIEYCNRVWAELEKRLSAFVERFLRASEEAKAAAKLHQMLAPLGFSVAAGTTLHNFVVSVTPPEEKTLSDRCIKLVQELVAKLEKDCLPCGHRLGDLVGGDGSVTKCGACLAAKLALNPPPVLPGPPAVGPMYVTKQVMTPDERKAFIWDISDKIVACLSRAADLGIAWNTLSMGIRVKIHAAFIDIIDAALLDRL